MMSILTNLRILHRILSISPKLAKCYQVLPNLSILTKSSQILAILPSITKYYQSCIESYQYYIESYQSYIESYQYDVESDESSNLTPNLINLTKVCQILSSSSKSFHPYKILSNLSHLTQYYQVLSILHRLLPILHRI